MSTCICSAGSKTGDYSHSDYCPIGKDQRIAELEQELAELRGELTTVQNAHSKALANNTALRKWITKLEGK